jgi:hypothetical protein
VPSRYLPIYLNDHLAGATAGLELARRTARENDGTPLGDFLRELAGEIAEDRQTLVQLMERLGIRRSGPKVAAGWVMEKVGRLKLNGQLTGYSPLSRLVELEGLSTGIEGKRALWVALAEIADRDVRLDEAELRALADRAASQRERLEPYRLAAAREALA